MRGATQSFFGKTLPGPNFNPRSSCEERRSRIMIFLRMPRFQSTLLMRGATSCSLGIFSCSSISIHAPHARSDRTAGNGTGMGNISIHAPHARSDLDALIGREARRDFNPRSSCEERPSLLAASRLCSVISIHAPHARSDGVLFLEMFFLTISIHAPHARSDFLSPRHDKYCRVFQSTLLMRGATGHTPGVHRSRQNFNPRSSCEERLCHFQALICLTSSYIFREPLASFRKHFF